VGPGRIDSDRLNDAGFFEGRNVAVEIHAANENYSRLPELAADLVRRQN
jgi:hypothetical protein